MSKSKKKFKSEVKELLDMVIHSLYSNHDIFLRELISNASDATDRLRFEALTNKDLIEENPDWKIKLTLDPDAGVLTISDNGIGMTRDEVEKNIGTIARSGTRAFLEELKKGESKDSLELIGQFGVGFYSSFMVADEVTLVTRRAGEAGATRWISQGNGSYTIEDCEKDSRGTEISLHLQEEKKDYLEEWKIRKIVKQFSDFVEYPVAMDVSREETPKDKDGNPQEDAEKVTVIEEQVLNSMKAIWMRPKNEIKKDEYNEFYKHISHDYTDPFKVIHFSAEGALEFKALVYIPGKAPFDLFHTRDDRKGIQLYVKRVFIMDDCKDLLPEYLRFVKGVVESNDLSLNISREILQENAVINKIQKSLVGKILKTLKELKTKKPDEYLKFYREFGRVLKEGVHFDFANKEKLQDLIMFESSKTEPGEFTSLRDYVSRQKDGQKEIYYLAGDSRDAVTSSPHLEIFKSKDVEVLYMTDPVDEWAVQSLSEYDGKPLKAIDRGDMDLDFAGDNADEKKKDEKGKTKDEKKFGKLIEFLKENLNDQVKDVRISTRLTDSISCLVADEFGMSPHMERMFAAMNQDAPKTTRILELNPKHPIMGIILRLYKNNKDDKKLQDYAALIYDQALLAEGTPVNDTSRLNRLISDLIVSEGTRIIADLKK